MKRGAVIQPLLACRVCLSEIPASVADASEARDYVHYFCGADCYLIWMEADTKSQESSTDKQDTFCAA